jgi:hypothetical protein
MEEFNKWCEDKGITPLQDFTPDDVKEFLRQLHLSFPKRDNCIVGYFDGIYFDLNLESVDEEDQLDFRVEHRYSFEIDMCGSYMSGNFWYCTIHEYDPEGGPRPFLNKFCSIEVEEFRTPSRKSARSAI